MENLKNLLGAPFILMASHWLCNWRSIGQFNYSDSQLTGSITSWTGRITSQAGLLQVSLLWNAQDGVAQWIQGAWGLAVEGITPGTHSKAHGPAHQEWPNPVPEDPWRTAALGGARRAPQVYHKAISRYIGIWSDKLDIRSLDWCLSL